MNNTTKHIGSLLYKHNCVIVPNFGGFVGNYMDAKVHPTQHLFSPPSKRIAFNKNLVNNDGLLANTIASETEISYTKAIEQIAMCVAQIKTELANGNKVEIDNVGILSLDTEKNIQFKPSNTNFSLESFGLPDVQSYPVLDATTNKRPETLFVNREPVKAPKKKRKYKRIALLALGLPVLLGVLWVSVETKPLNNFNYASIFPFNTSVKTATTATKTEAAEKENTVATKTEIAPTAPVTSKLVKEETTKTTAQNTNYHIVIGCFKEKSNAERFINELKAENLQASIAGKNDKDLYVISGGDYNSKDEAYQQLSKLKAVQPNAWLFTYRF